MLLYGVSIIEASCVEAAGKPCLIETVNPPSQRHDGPFRRILRRIGRNGNEIDIPKQIRPPVKWQRPIQKGLQLSAYRL